MQGESHRIPGPRFRRIDEQHLAAWDEENVDKLGIHRKGTESSLVPTEEDAARMGRGRKDTAID
ncbi:hypothetical protein [Alicyclobacillus dauci]|uniref:Uncharacterized protein n=1 Tax=Alicyclobacillus dauci TaxID=1475485 RepID=A0ABY6Z7Y6_9BACL|nr:hypothetical protein [Alicyclobacillus dauci]WAH38904.1 hypothetical protein NZD86_10695 [Alicyclobacillus dauci]